MDLVIKSAKQRMKGFSLVEIVVVLGIIALFAGISTTVYTTMRSKNNLEIATSSIVEALRFAKSNAEQVQNDSMWGVYVTSNQVTVFSGSSYAGRDTSKDKTLALPQGIVVSGLSEVVFEKVFGTTNVTNAIIITGADGSQTISINAKGTITY